MKAISLLFSILFITTACAQEFEIIEATTQKWAGGRMETGHGVYYNIVLIAKKKSQKLSFDKFWVDSIFFSIKAYKHSGNKNIEKFSSGDTLYINVRSRFNSIKNDENTYIIKKSVKEMPPFELKGTALLGYTYKGKRKYKNIEVFKELKPVYYP